MGNYEYLIKFTVTIKCFNCSGWVKLGEAKEKTRPAREAANAAINTKWLLYPQIKILSFAWSPEDKKPVAKDSIYKTSGLFMSSSFKIRLMSSIKKSKFPVLHQKQTSILSPS